MIARKKRVKAAVRVSAAESAVEKMIKPVFEEIVMQASKHGDISLVNWRKLRGMIKRKEVDEADLRRLCALITGKGFVARRQRKVLKKILQKKY